MRPKACAVLGWDVMKAMTLLEVTLFSVPPPPWPPASAPLFHRFLSGVQRQDYRLQVLLTSCQLVQEQLLPPARFVQQLAPVSG